MLDRQSLVFTCALLVLFLGGIAADMSMVSGFEIPSSVSSVSLEMGGGRGCCLTSSWIVSSEGVVTAALGIITKAFDSSGSSPW